jgi:signal transduction histidine kinase
VVLPGPMFITRGLGVAMVLSGGSFAWIALRQFFDKSPRWDVAAVGPLLWLLVTRLPAVANDPGWQMMFSWGIGAFYMVILTWALRPDGTEYLPARTSALIFLGIHGIVFALRAFLAGTGLDGQYRDLLSNILIIEGQFRVIGTSFLVLALTKQRAENIAARNLEAAERASDARRRFVAQMSHEVRTPLNGVFGLAQVLAQDSRLLPDQREHAQALEIAGRHLLSIVNDALDLAKIDADRLEPASRAFDPASTTEDCLALLRPNALDKRITLRFEPDSALPLRVLGDQTRLQQILLNLLSNALKFTPERGSVTLRTVTLPAGLRFDIIDTGPGVPPDQRHLLFKDFSQLDPSTSEGTGLGLAISARLAERLGGSLRYVPRGHDRQYLPPHGALDRSPRRPAAPPRTTGSHHQRPSPARGRRRAGQSRRAARHADRRRPHRQRSAWRPRGARSNPPAPLRHDPAGHPHARYRRPGSHHPPAGHARLDLRSAHHRRVRRRHARDHPSLPGRGHGRRPAQTRRIRRPSERTPTPAYPPPRPSRRPRVGASPHLSQRGD